MYFLVKRPGRTTWLIKKVSEVAGNPAYKDAEVEGPMSFADARPKQLRRNREVREKLQRQRRRAENAMYGSSRSAWAFGRRRVV